MRVRPPTGSQSGNSDPETGVNLNSLTIFTKNRNTVVLATDSPRHLRFPENKMRYYNSLRLNVFLACNEKYWRHYDVMLKIHFLHKAQLIIFLAKKSYLFFELHKAVIRDVVFGFRAFLVTRSHCVQRKTILWKTEFSILEITWDQFILRGMYFP